MAYGVAGPGSNREPIDPSVPSPPYGCTALLLVWSPCAGHRRLAASVRRRQPPKRSGQQAMTARQACMTADTVSNGSGPWDLSGNGFLDYITWLL